jgi:hypothetical protein
MLAALLCNQPYTVPSRGYEDHYVRRPNEKVKWCDEIEAQELITKFEALPEEKQKIVVKEVVKTIKASESEIVEDAQDVLEDFDTTAEMLHNIAELRVMLKAYYLLKCQRRRKNNTAALILLGVL